MGNKARKPTRKPFTPLMKLWIRCVVSGDTRPEIIQKIFHVDVNADPMAANRADQQMFRWRHHPDYEKEWNAAYREVWGNITHEALRELKQGLHDQDLPWRRTQHVNLALSYGTKIVSGEDSALKVQIVGMPELGNPDGEGSDDGGSGEEA